MMGKVLHGLLCEGVQTSVKASLNLPIHTEASCQKQANYTALSFTSELPFEEFTTSARSPC